MSQGYVRNILFYFNALLITLKWKNLNKFKVLKQIEKKRKLKYKPIQFKHLDIRFVKLSSA